MKDGVMPNTGKPFNKQRERESRLDGKAKVGADHSEFPGTDANLGKAAEYLDRCDSLDMHMLRKGKNVG
jgi:hypothetical protein